ncbi:hypothetical protein CF319_g4603 [Tilletia indica]|nr:hypothetical protein CF319_g4603 [Tilletia indica]
MASPSSATPSKNTKWVTHLSLSADLILGKATTENCVHEIECTMDDAEGEIHKVGLNCWARDVPEQGVYLLNNVPFATHPLRLGVPDVACLRMVPDDLDGDGNGVVLPASPINFTGIGVITWVSTDRKSCVLRGLTYLNKTHQWQQWSLNATFPQTPKYEMWTTPGPRSLVNFDCTVLREGEKSTFDTALNRITLLGPAPGPLLQALSVVSPATDDRAERIRQARAARQEQLKEKSIPDVETPSTPKTTVPDSEPTTPADPSPTPARVPRSSTPTPTQGKSKRGRHE